jgi:hypothetical protein
VCRLPRNSPHGHGLLSTISSGDVAFARGNCRLIYCRNPRRRDRGINHQDADPHARRRRRQGTRKWPRCARAFREPLISAWYVSIAEGERFLREHYCALYTHGRRGVQYGWAVPGHLTLWRPSFAEGSYARFIRPPPRVRGSQAFHAATPRAGSSPQFGVAGIYRWAPGLA